MSKVEGLSFINNQSKKPPLTSYTPPHVLYKATNNVLPASIPFSILPIPDSRPPHLTVSAKPAVPSLQAGCNRAGYWDRLLTTGLESLHGKNFSSVTD